MIKNSFIDDSPIYLTPEGIEYLKERLARLKKALPNYIVETQRTAAYGDRSDNAEYKEAKSILRRTNRQIFNLEDKLKRAAVIPAGRNAKGTVQLGSTVLLETKEGLRKTFQILGPQETNPGQGRISHQSPIGAALIGHKERDLITVQTVSGPKEYRIIEIR